MRTSIRVIETCSRLLAAAGGVIVAAVALITVASVIGRALHWAGLGPIRGDFEMVTIGCGVAAFWFMPFVHMSRGHITVDLLHDVLPKPARKALTFLGDFTVLAVSAVIAWRLWFGLLEKYAYGETTMILGAPVWPGYALAMFGAVAFVAAALAVLLREFLGSGED